MVAERWARHLCSLARSLTLRRPFKLIRFVVLQLVIVAVLLEIVLRLIHPHSLAVRNALYMATLASDFDQAASVEDLLEDRFMGFQPFVDYSGYIRNSRGLRTKEYTNAKPAGTTRVVALGDSFTLSSGGVPHPLLWHTLLEQQLDAASSNDIEVLNLGVGGTGPLFQRRMWQVEGARLDADVVLLGFFVGNDLFDHQKVTLQENVNEALAQESYALRFVRNAWRRLKFGRERTPEAGERPAMIDEDIAPTGARTSGGYPVDSYNKRFANRKPNLTPEALLEVEGDRMRICDASWSDSFETLFERAAKTIAALHEEVALAGAELLVVIIPDRFQVNVEERAEILAFKPRPEQGLDWDKPQRRLVAFLKERGIAHIDLLPLFAATGRGDLYAEGNTHWGVEGNALTAEILTPFFLDRGLVPAATSDPNR